MGYWGSALQTHDKAGWSNCSKRDCLSFGDFRLRQQAVESSRSQIKARSDVLVLGQPPERPTASCPPQINHRHHHHHLHLHPVLLLLQTVIFFSVQRTYRGPEFSFSKTQTKINYEC